MDKGYIKNGFIVNLSNSRKTSEIIYELSRILDIPEAQNKQVCLKLGAVDLSQTELTSIKALVESMDSQIEFISTDSAQTTESAKALGIEVAELENVVEAPDFESEPNIRPEVETALDKIFGENTTESPMLSQDNLKEIGAVDNYSDIASIEKAEDVDIYEEDVDEETLQMRAEAEGLPSLYLKKTIRSGQSITSDGNLCIIGDVNPGAEVIAKGDITVWGVLGGIAHAGCDGNTQARVRALKMNAIQLRIADIFARRPDGVNTPFVQKSNEFVPEEARVFKKNIIINKILEN